uniref:Glycosyl transferase family 1 domain-containing protein n=1 Tax=Homalodisca liturata TaxID=320908 RepID=A0A1B6HQG2_9HEMI
MVSNVIVVVLGDIGRSPRMQYHASSLLKERFSVKLIGYGGSKPIEYLNSHPSCEIKTLTQPPQFNQYLPVLATYILKVLWQVLTLIWILLRSQRPQHLIVQTPPAIPALAVCWFYCRLVGAKFVIDWHNYAFSIMALTHGQGHKLVRISEKFEGFFGRRSDSNLCVTRAMKDDLKKRWDIKAVTLYDRPPEHFGSLTPEERRTLMVKYPELSSQLDETKRPALLVSSTSWTEDEDFSILLSALQDYDRSEEPGLPKMLCVITGKGPLRDLYMQQVEAQEWSKVTVTSLWLEAEDYPRLLASADLGVSLHTSSSGLDLPMKVVDMMGCGLPVTAYNFSCLHELVQHKENGLVFNDSTELAQQLQDWFREFPSNKSRDQFSPAIRQLQSLRWHDNWKIQALPLFSHQ